jgi:hypothetical protein
VGDPKYDREEVRSGTTLSAKHFRLAMREGVGYTGGGRRKRFWFAFLCRPLPAKPVALSHPWNIVAKIELARFGLDERFLLKTCCEVERL